MSRTSLQHWGRHLFVMVFVGPPVVSWDLIMYSWAQVYTRRSEHLAQSHGCHLQLLFGLAGALNGVRLEAPGTVAGLARTTQFGLIFLGFHTPFLGFQTMSSWVHTTVVVLLKAALNGRSQVKARCQPRWCRWIPPPVNRTGVLYGAEAAREAD